MRPDLSDVLSGVQRLILSEIIPALGETPYLQEQATYATLLLEYVKGAWPRQHLELLGEHVELCDALRRLGLALGGVDLSGAAALAREIDAALAGDPNAARELALDALLARGRSLRELLERAIVLLVDGRAPGAAAALAIVDAYLARQAERRDAARVALGVNW